jgi:prepilin peptidase CpaA
MGAVEQGGVVVLPWAVWLVTVVLVVAAVIDGWKLKVPNWITFPLVISGWIYSACFSHAVETWWEGLLWSLLGTCVGLALLLPAYAIGGMGAGDVKLLAGVGAWMWSIHTLWGFAVSAIAGGIIAVVMVLVRRSWTKHKNQFWMIFTEILTVRDPEKLATIAAERKSQMLLLPYGIPLAVGTIAYFAFTGMLP